MATHEHYYVPAQSKWPIIATVGMFVTVFGLATWFNDLKAARPESHGPLIFFVGSLLLAYMLFGWFGTIGLGEADFRSRVYMAAVCRCFPGKNPKGGDRVPDVDEIGRCSKWLDAEIGLLQGLTRILRQGDRALGFLTALLHIRHGITGALL